MGTIRWVIGLAAVLALPSAAYPQRGVTPLLTPPGTLPRGAQSFAGYVTIEDETDLFGVYRRGLGGDLDLGLRLGYTDTGDGGIHLGGDLRYKFGGPRSPELDFALAGGLQLSFADRGNWVAVPFGVAMGTDVGTGERAVVVYGLPFLQVYRVDPDFGDSETELEVGLELGAEIELTLDWLVRAGLVVGSHDDDEVSLALGLVYR